jgi:hypothetical protein
MRSLIGCLLAVFVVLLLLLVFKVGMLHQNLLIYDENLANLEEYYTRLLCVLVGVTNRTQGAFVTVI